MARAHLVQKAAKDYPEHGIKKGEPYYWWKFRYGGKRFSKTAPKRSQLTQSSFYSTVYDIEDDVIGGAEPTSDLGSIRDDVVQQLGDLRDECQSSLDNIPDSLKEGSSGQLLQERIDALESAISEFEQLDLDEPSDSDLDWPERNEDESDEDYEARKEEARSDVEEEFWRGKLEEFQAISIDAP